MKKSSLFLSLFLVTIVCFGQKAPVKQTKPKPAPTVAAAIPSSGSFIGSIHNDLLYVVNEPRTGDSSKQVSGRFANILSRASLGYRHSFSGDVSAAVMYDGASGTMQQAFVDIRNLAPLVDLRLGMGQTLSSESPERMFPAFRALGKPVLERSKMNQEFDMGLTMTARTDPQGSSYARVAVYNGNGPAAENNKQKKLAMSVGYWINSASLLEVYVDYENAGNGKKAINAKSFIGLNAADYGAGGEFFYRIDTKVTAATNKTPVGASLFGWMELMRSLRGVLRTDVVDWDLNQDANVYREISLNAGMDYMPAADVHLMPNLVYVKNLKKGTGAGIADRIELRLTTSVAFK
jgi:hypothetical protein